jgi:aspartate ammonia-lyase
VRQEEDSIGKIQLPSDRLYGVRTARCLENLSFSGCTLSQYPELISALAVVKKACALANIEAATIPAELGSMISAQCDRLLSGEFQEHFPVDMLHGGGYIAFNTNINEVLANLANAAAGSGIGTYAPVDPKTHVNCGQSTADVCHTAVRLAIIGSFEKLSSALDLLISSFRRLQTEFAPINTVARTCLQDAMPVSLGESFGAYTAFVERRKQECARAVADLHQINLGGTVIGSGDGADEKYRHNVVQKLSNICQRNLRWRANLYDAAQNIDDLIAVSSQLRILAEGLIKIAKDIRLLSSGPNCGFSELVLPAVQEGSSFFAGKINPVVPETMIQACMQVLGCDRAAAAALEHAELNLNIFEGVAAKNVLDACRMLTAATQLFELKCVSGIRARQDVCQSHAESVMTPSARLAKGVAIT